MYILYTHTLFWCHFFVCTKYYPKTKNFYSIIFLWIYVSKIWIYIISNTDLSFSLIIISFFKRILSSIYLFLILGCIFPQPQTPYCFSVFDKPSLILAQSYKYEAPTEDWTYYSYFICSACWLLCHNKVSFIWMYLLEE